MITVTFTVFSYQAGGHNVSWCSHMTFLHIVTISKFLQAEVWMVISSPTASSRSPGTFFFPSNCIFGVDCLFVLIKIKAPLTNHEILPWLLATPSDLKEQNPRKKRHTGWFSFPLLMWLMYCIASMFTDSICLVMSAQWMAEKGFWCAIGSFALALNASVFLFCLVLNKQTNKQTEIESCNRKLC